MRILVLMMVVLAGCAADAPAPTSSGDELELMDTERPATAMDGGDDALDVCGLAAELPADDICHHVCDPQAMADQLVADGADAGACYQLYCQLTPTTHVIAGVCLAP